MFVMGKYINFFLRFFIQSVADVNSAGMGNRDSFHYFLTLLHSESPILYTILAFLSAVG